MVVLLRAAAAGRAPQRWPCCCAVGALVVGGTRPARADYEVDPTGGVPVSGVDFQGAVDDCLKGFAGARR